MPLQCITDDVIMNNPQVAHKSICVHYQKCLVNEKKKVNKTECFVQVLGYKQWEETVFLNSKKFLTSKFGLGKSVES